jgi:glycosyltransferase involved in cell wall biosynthesis
MTSIDKKRILIFSDWYLPGYRGGGPIRSLANLVSTLRHEFYIVTRNTDHYSTDPYPNIVPDKWIKTADNVHVFYFDEGSISAAAIRDIIRDLKCDRIYFNSLFSPRFTLLPLRVARKMKLQDRCILAPRGMLKSGALSVKARKKKIFLTMVRFFGFFNGIRWHATSEEEAIEIKRTFPGTSNIRIAPNLSSAPHEKPAKIRKRAGELKMICIARISPEKGILEALQFLQQADLRGDVSVEFYGTPQNTAYLAACRALAQNIRGIHISFRGEIVPLDIPAVLTQHHFFYLATLGENFGHAIAEALTNATPVIISNTTPWTALKEKNAGWDLPLSADAFKEVLQYCLAMGGAEYESWSEGAYKYGQQVALDSASISACYAIFE